MKTNERSQTDHAHERGMGVMNGGDLPMANRNTEENMGNSMPDTTAGALESGFMSEGSITGDTMSHPATMNPGKQNQGKDEIGEAPEKR